MKPDFDVVAAIAGLIVGVVWLVRLEGRVKLLDAAYKHIIEDVAEIKADVKLLLRASRGTYPE